MVVGFESTGTVDLVLEFRVLEFGKWRTLRLGVKSCELSIESGLSYHRKI